MKRPSLLYALLICLRLQATHIVGGEMIYDYLGQSSGGDNMYRITLKIYRDCLNGQADFDGIQGIAYISILKGDGSIYGTGPIDIGMPVVRKVPSSINSPCVQVPQTVCVEEGVYTTTITLPQSTNGYYVVYQRCCRNNSIVNILQPGQQGSTYYAKIPGTDDAAVNSSPRFTDFPPIFLCSGINLSFSHKAVDPDGDYLEYSFFTPLNGLDACCPMLGGGTTTDCATPAPCPPFAPAPPYPPINFVAPYSYNYPVASSPSLTIDQYTGKLKGFPTLQGQYVVSICVKEYRGGKLLSTHYRDFQFNIISCVVDIIAEIADPPKQCIGNTIKFGNLSQSTTGPMNFRWDFGVPGTQSDTSLQFEPAYTYQDTGKFTVTLIGNPGKQCSDTVRKDFWVYPALDVNFNAPPVVCLARNSIDFKVNGAYLGNALFNWDFTGAATPSVGTGVTVNGVHFTAPGHYAVKLKGQQLQCSDAFEDSVIVRAPPTVSATSEPYQACDPVTVKFNNGSKGEDPFTSYWSFGNGQVSTVAAPEMTFSPAGEYIVRLLVVSNGFCRDSALAPGITITVSPRPVSAFYVSSHQVTILDPVVSIRSKALGADILSYSFGDGTMSSFSNGTHFFEQEGSYIVTQSVMNGFGCVDSSSQVVNVLGEYRFWIPNAFTPDENGLNDLFMPVAIGVKSYVFEIFDRWGQLLFRTEDPAKGWNGSFRGKPCKQDVYVWRVFYKSEISGEAVSRAGNVTLLRNP